jgi:hypothetical protein
MSGTIIVVTGGNRGIGFETCRAKFVSAISSFLGERKVIPWRWARIAIHNRNRIP